MAKLQNDSLRERHLKILLSKADQKLDVNLNQLRLSHLFAMELHKYQVKSQ